MCCIRYQVLPLAPRDCLDEEVRQVVLKVSRVFQRLCTREIKIADRDQDMTDAAESLCRRAIHLRPRSLQVDVPS
jgi:hypothetical protein